MTNAEAIKILGECKFCRNAYKGECVSDSGCFEAKTMAIKALDRQIKKKPILHHFYENETDYSYYTCANRCDKYCQINKQDNFCKKCGQAIDWSE